MKALFASLAAFLIVAMFGFTLVDGATLTSHLAAPLPAAQASQPNIAVQLTALQETNDVRYSVTIINSADLALPALHTLVTLPNSANLLQALDTEGYTHFVGAFPTSQGLTLSWSANFNAGDYVDAFVFTLDGPAPGAIGVNLMWGGSQPGQVVFWGQPTVLAAGLAENDITLSAAGTGDSLIPVGGTGVLIGVASNQVPDGTKLHFRLVDQSQDPPATGDLWWCSVLEVTGLPAGASINVVVPLREPLPPGALVNLFAYQANGAWTPLTEQGIVTFDGQHAAYTQNNGTVAAGIQNRFQPKLVKPPLKTTPLPPTKIPPTTANKPPPTVPAVLPRPTIAPPQIKVLTGTPTKIANQPTLTPTPPVSRSTRLPPPPIEVTHLPPTVPPPTATVVTTKAPQTTASPSPTIGVKPLPSPTATTAQGCTTAFSQVVCLNPGGSTIATLCTKAGASCISTGHNGQICVTLGGKQVCGAPNGSVVFVPGSGFQLVPTATPVVIVVTATFAPQPTVCVQDVTGTIACTNQNGQLLPLPTATPRSDGGECFDYTEGGPFGSATFTICVNVNGTECVQSSDSPFFDPPFICLSPNQPGYITPP